MHSLGTKKSIEKTSEFDYILINQISFHFQTSRKKFIQFQDNNTSILINL